MATDDWKTPGFRQSVAAKIEDAIRQSGNPTTKTASEMETHFFQRATTREDYLNYLARLLIHIKELSSKQKAQAASGAQAGNVSQSNPQQQGNVPPVQMMNQMNVRPQQMMTIPIDQQQAQPQMNQQQLINQQQLMNQQQQQMNQLSNNQQQQHQLTANLNNQQQMNQLSINQQQQQQMMNQFNPNQNMNFGNASMQQLGPNQQGNSMNPNPGSALLNQLNQNQQNMGPMNPGMQRPRFATAANAKLPPQQQQQQQLINPQLLMQRKQQNDLIQNQVQGPSTPQFTGPAVPSPATMMTPMSSSVPNITNQMGAPSPAYVHSPGNVQLVSSPATSGRTMGVAPGQQRGLGSLLPPPSPSMMNVPTPGGGGMLHTPQGAGMGMPVAAGTPVAPMTASNSGEDQVYLEKVRQLSRFIEPLTRLISRYGDEDSEKLSKMKIMLDILSNPNKRMPMDTLLKCEAVLEKMDFKRSESGSVAPPSVASVPSLGVAVPSTKDHPPAATPLHPFLETIANQARSPYFNHTLQRTFAPAVNALIGCDISRPVDDAVDFTGDDHSDADELMAILEMEIANMNPRFKVDLDQLHLIGSLDLQLVCKLEDPYLPSVPPLQITVPQDYPRTAPLCSSQQHLYDVSQFTRDILQGLLDRLRHMPQRYSVSQILYCWEMAVRHACRPNFKREINSMAISLGY